MKTPEEGYAKGWADAIYAYESKQRKSMSTVGDAMTQEPITSPDGLPIIPGFPDNIQRPADGAVAVCGVCGLRVMPVMHYVCSNPRCGVFPKVTCQVPT